MFELFSVIVVDFFTFVVVFVEYFANFGVKGLHLRPEGHHLAPWGLPGSILERFGGSSRSHWGSWGDLWGHIGASDGAFWCLSCCIYFRHVFGSKLLPELFQKDVPGHAIM